MTRQQATSISLLNGWTLPSLPLVHPPALSAPLVHLSWDSSSDTLYRIFQDDIPISPFLTSNRFTIPVFQRPLKPIIHALATFPETVCSGLHTSFDSSVKNAIDGNISTHWEADVPAYYNPWIAVDLLDDVPIISYAIHVASPPVSLFVNNSISGWKLQAAKSATPSSWEDIHIGNVPFSFSPPWTYSLDGIYPEYDISPSVATFSTSQSYRHWRLVITDARDYEASPIYLSEWMLFQEALPPFAPSPTITIQPTGALSGLSNIPLPFPSILAISSTGTRVLVIGENTHNIYTLPFILSSEFNASIQAITHESFSIEIDGLPPIFVRPLISNSDYTVVVQVYNESVIELTRVFTVHTLPLQIFLRERQLVKTIHQSQNAIRNDFRVIRTIAPVPDF